MIWYRVWRKLIYMCKLRKELPPVNLVAVTCDSWSGMTGKLVPGSIIVCSMGSSAARGVKITGICRSPPLPHGIGRRRLAALSGLPDSAARRQNFFGSYCIKGCNYLSVGCNYLSLFYIPASGRQVLTSLLLWSVFIFILLLYEFVSSGDILLHMIDLNFNHMIHCYYWILDIDEWGLGWMGLCDGIHLYLVCKCLYIVPIYIDLQLLILMLQALNCGMK